MIAVDIIFFSFILRKWKGGRGEQNEEALLVRVLPGVVRGELEGAEKLCVGLIEEATRVRVDEDSVPVAPDHGVGLRVAGVDELSVDAVIGA